MYLGGWYTSKMRAALYYSKDSSFTTKSLLIADTLLSGNAVMPLEATLDETVNSGETFYLRVYPHNTEAVGWAKLVAVDSVIISGTTTGATAEPPTVTTGAVSYISTTFATAGGTVTSDGGSAVLTRGVCWDTTTAPTIDKNKTENGSGSGTFTSQLTGLTAGMTYYLRAYATNAAGTAYGQDVTFKTLDSTEVPTVVTAEVTNIMVKTANCGGNVTDWGGDTVLVRGVCWNPTGNPSIADNKTENGSGLGSFQSLIYGLAENTTYYVRAYATNKKGTGYGAVDTFTTQTPAPQIVKIVAADSSGDYTTVQAAFDDVPDYYTGPYIIYVKKGVYYEKMLLNRYKTNVMLIGEDVNETILTYDDYAGKAGGTSMSYSVGIDADDFTAMNITFQNTVKNDGTFADQQAVALRVNGDRQAYYNCRLLGYQDTYYTWGGRGTGRVYMKNCYIEGSVDFIFGRDIVVFDSCEIHINRNGGTLTAASTEPESKFGYVFRDCNITADAVGFNEIPIVSFYLGRPWQASPRTVFIRCNEPQSLNAAGWIAWNVTPALYAEYQCFGEGSDFSARASISRQLTDEEYPDYTLENIFSKESNPNLGFDWMPKAPDYVGIDPERHTAGLPTEYRLAQNYPNPFNPSTTIKYDLIKPGRVTITVYNLLGEKIMTLVNADQPAGYHAVVLDGGRLASGIYFYRIESGNFCKTKKMMLLK
jgi:pectinesterase